MSSSESDEAPLSESAGKESKRSISSLGCGFIVLAFEEFLVLGSIVAACRQEHGELDNGLIIVLLVGIFLVHVMVQCCLMNQDDPVNCGLEAIQDEMGHADFEQLFAELYSAAPSIEHIAVGTKRGPKFMGGGHRLENQVIRKQTESQVFAYTSWRDVSHPVSGRDGPSLLTLAESKSPKERSLTRGPNL